MYVIAKERWDLCISSNKFIRAAHVKGSLDIDADLALRVFHDDIEYMLDLIVFRDTVCKKFCLSPQKTT